MPAYSITYRYDGKLDPFSGTSWTIYKYLPIIAYLYPGIGRGYRGEIITTIYAVIESISYMMYLIYPEYSCGCTHIKQAPNFICYGLKN